MKTMAPNQKARLSLLRTRLASKLADAYYSDLMMLSKTEQPQPDTEERLRRLEAVAPGTADLYWKILAAVEP